MGMSHLKFPCYGYRVHSGDYTQYSISTPGVLHIWSVHVLKKDDIHLLVQYEILSVIQSCSVCISIYTHTVMNTTILQLVAIYNIKLHVLALFVGHHQVVQRTY